MSLDSVTSIEPPLWLSSRLGKNSPHRGAEGDITSISPISHLLSWAKAAFLTLVARGLCPLLSRIPSAFRSPQVGRRQVSWLVGTQPCSCPLSLPLPTLRGQDPPRSPRCWGQRVTVKEPPVSPRRLTCKLKTHYTMCSLFLHRVLQAPRASLSPSWPSSQL